MPRSANDRHVQRPTLREGAHEPDVCIIGAGFTGISAALELSEKRL
jgi:gamma-glutamylputrescine oxidase